MTRTASRNLMSRTPVVSNSRILATAPLPSRDSDAGPEARSRRAVFIVGDVRLYRESLARALSDEESLRVIGAGPPEEESLRQIAMARPQVILVDSANARRPDFVRRLSI